MQLTYYGEASDTLLDDLRADAGMGWIPESAWLTKLSIGSTTRELRYDLAVDASGEGRPSLMRAGLFSLPNLGDSPAEESSPWLQITIAAGSLLIIVALCAWGVAWRPRGNEV
jgi:hypothetical protein